MVIPTSCTALLKIKRAKTRLGLDLFEAGYRSPVRLLEPGRKRRGRPTSFWLWTLAGAFTVLLVLGLVLR
jgi:hypothetical protein